MSISIAPRPIAITSIFISTASFSKSNKNAVLASLDWLLMSSCTILVISFTCTRSSGIIACGSTNSLALAAMCSSSCSILTTSSSVSRSPISNSSPSPHSLTKLILAYFILSLNSESLSPGIEIEPLLSRTP